MVTVILQKKKRRINLCFLESTLAVHRLGIPVQPIETERNKKANSSIL